MKPICYYALAGALALGCLPGEAPAASRKGKPAQSLYLTNVHMVSKMTGAPLEEETCLHPNATDRDYDVHGTDLGIMWRISGDRIGIFFGDTNGEGFKTGNGGCGSNWRSNVLAFSSDTDLSDGLRIDSMALDAEGKAREICAGGKAQAEPYQTSIPTSAIRAGKTDCVHFMNIYEWAGGKGRWLTNFSSIYTSDDDGRTWQRQEGVTFSPDSHFSQVAYAKKDGWVYMIGTQSGRGDAAYLCRFREKDLLDMGAYLYWNGSDWVADEQAAVPVLRGPIGEASLMFHEGLKRWIYTYSYDPGYDKDPVTRVQAVLYCDTDDITRWDGERKVLLTHDKYPIPYCAFMYPETRGDKVYFALSMWQPYNVYLMSADLELRPDEAR
ncbi:MAG: DUF4185 domain-containing protein [Rikenellaceae bacterium]|nr:DUF4185 domain-containing protein [Rikenellaceae bacterium]